MRLAFARPTAYLLTILASLAGSDALAAEPPAPLVDCHVKSFPNLPGENAFTLTAVGSGWVASFTSYDKPKRYPKLACKFLAEAKGGDRGVFYCHSGSKLAVIGELRREVSVDADGMPKVFEGFQFEVLSNPLGVARSMMTVRFETGGCAFPAAS